MSGRSTNKKEHAAWMPGSVYENPDLISVNGRVVIISGPVTVFLNYAAGYAFSAYRDSPWVQDVVSFVLGFSGAFATRFEDLQSLTQAGGYYYVGSMVVSSVAAVALSLVIFATYMRITFWSDQAAPFRLESILGIGFNISFAAFVIYIYFFIKMNTGPYLGMSRFFFPQVFPLFAYGVALAVAVAVLQIVVFVMKFIYLREEKGNG